MVMHNPLTPGTSSVLAVYSSSDISEGWTYGVFPVHVLSMGLSLAITVGWLSSTSMAIAGSWMRLSS